MRACDGRAAKRARVCDGESQSFVSSCGGGGGRGGGGGGGGEWWESLGVKRRAWESLVVWLIVAR